MIKFKKDENKWWPWLAIDTSTYNTGGSCLGKRQNGLFLEDCYKKMPFACQIKPKTKSIASSSKSNPRIQLKCGNKIDNPRQTTLSFSTIQIPVKSIEEIISTSPLAVVIASLNETNYALNTKSNLTSNSS